MVLTRLGVADVTWLLVLLGVAAYLGLAVLVGMFCGVGNCDDGFWESAPGERPAHGSEGEASTHTGAA